VKKVFTSLKELEKEDSMFKKYGDIYASVFLLIFSGTMFVSSFGIKQLTHSRIGSQFLPQVVSIGIFLLSLILLYQGIKQMKAIKKVEALDTKNIDEKQVVTAENVVIKEQHEDPKQYLGVVITLGLIIIYVALLPYLGFILASIAYLFTQMCLLAHKSKRKYWLFLVISIMVSVSVYYLFKNVLYLMLPAGILG
jgi:putative tricarboxylic transport membrane protein